MIMSHCLWQQYKYFQLFGLTHLVSAELIQQRCIYLIITGKRI